VGERTAGDTDIVAALARFAAALTAGDQPTALVAAQQATSLALSANSPYSAVAEACVEHAGGHAAEVSHQALSYSCSFCGATEDEARLIAGPDVFICESCIGSGGDELVARRGAGDATWNPCSFCNRPPTESAPALATTDDSICAKCVSLCARILSGGDA
jgi:ClpX C4-type zinc finger